MVPLIIKDFRDKREKQSLLKLLMIFINDQRNTI